MKNNTSLKTSTCLNVTIDGTIVMQTAKQPQRNQTLSILKSV